MTLTPRLSIAAVAIVLGGCSAAPADVPPASPTKLPTTAPRVERQLDASAFKANPCALFTDEQAAAIGYAKPGVPYEKDGEAQCFREGEQSPKSQFTLRYYPAIDLLGQIYRREKTWPANSASPITVAGQPALKTNLPTTEMCYVAVGLADSQGFEVVIQDKQKDSCAQVLKIAEAVMHNIGA